MRFEVGIPCFRWSLLSEGNNVSAETASRSPEADISEWEGGDKWKRLSMEWPRRQPLLAVCYRSSVVDCPQLGQHRLELCTVAQRWRFQSAGVHVLDELHVLVFTMLRIWFECHQVQKPLYLFASRCLEGGKECSWLIHLSDTPLYVNFFRANPLKGGNVRRNLLQYDIQYFEVHVQVATRDCSLEADISGRRMRPMQVAVCMKCLHDVRHESAIHDSGTDHVY